MPQIVEVLKYVHDVIEKDDLTALNVLHANMRGDDGSGGGSSGSGTGRGFSTNSQYGGGYGGNYGGGNTGGRNTGGSGNQNQGSSTPNTYRQTDSRLQTSYRQESSPTPRDGLQKTGLSQVSQHSQLSQGH